MVTVIPFSGQIDKSEQEEWISAINHRAQHFTITSVEQLSDSEKSACEVAIVANPDITTLKDLPNLKWIQSLWAGVENLLSTGISDDIKIVRLTDPQMAESMAEAVLTWCLYLHRSIPQYIAQQKDKNWQPGSLDLPGKCNITVFGLGNLGSRAADRLRQNGFTVRGWCRSKKAIDDVECFHGQRGLQQVLPLTDIAVLLLPLTADTRNLIDDSVLQRLPANSAIINFARGDIVVEEDLLTHLNSGHIQHAVLDVFAKEPLPQTHPFWTHPSVSVLPHISAPTTIETAATIAASGIDRFIQKGVIPDAVDRSRGY